VSASLATAPHGDTTPTQAAPDTHTPAPAEPAASCGGQGHASCGAVASEGSCGSGSGEASCGCGQEQGTAHAASCGGATTGSTQPRTGTQADETAVLTRIEDPSQICMVRNHFMGRPQLAVQADGSTYYGCCAGCANRLLQDPQARQAIDPVSNNPVDKAVAVLAKTSRGRVLYFENEANLEFFRATVR